MARMRGKQFRASTNKVGTRQAEDTPSSNIVDHTYSPETGQLTITYRGGRQYLYHGVSEEVAAGLGNAESKGRYIHANIIDKHKAVRL